MITYPPYACVVLAGGAARRMEGTAQYGLKTLLPLSGKPILEHICTSLRNAEPAPQDIALNIVAEQMPLAPDMPIALDATEERQGPLSGILAGLNWCAQHNPNIQWLLSVSGDTPFLPSDLAKRLLDVAITQQKSIVCTASDQRRHPTIALWSSSLRAPLETALAQDIRKIELFSRQYSPAIVEWDCNDRDPFLNINQPEDLEAAEKFLSCKHKV